MYSRVYMGKGHAYKMNNQLDSAIFYAEKAISCDKSDSYGYQLMGSAYFAMDNKTDMAIEYLSKAVELEPMNNWSNVMLGLTLYYFKNDMKKGLPYINMALKSGGRATNGYMVILDLFSFIWGI